MQPKLNASAVEMSSFQVHILTLKSSSLNSSTTASWFGCGFTPSLVQLSFHLLNTHFFLWLYVRITFEDFKNYGWLDPIQELLNQNLPKASNIQIKLRTTTLLTVH